jgi:hypothetical protein
MPSAIVDGVVLGCVCYYWGRKGIALRLLHPYHLTLRSSSVRTSKLLGTSFQTITIAETYHMIETCDDNVCSWYVLACFSFLDCSLACLVGS